MPNTDVGGRLPTGSFADKPTLRGTRVTLRPIVAGDAGAMFASLDDPEGRRLTGTHGTFTRETIDRWAASRAAQSLSLSTAKTVLPSSAASTVDPPEPYSRMTEAAA